jgi:hypothetical protein
MDDDDEYTQPDSEMPALNSQGAKPGLKTVGPGALPPMQELTASSDPESPLNAFYSDMACSGLKTRFLQVEDNALQFADGPSQEEYLPGSNCLWAVATIPGYQMRVQFERFELEQPADVLSGNGMNGTGSVCSDFVVLRETTENIMSCAALRQQILDEQIGVGAYDTATLPAELGGGDPLTHGPFCGDLPPVPFTSGSNELVVQFCSDSGRDSVGHGFRGAFSVVGQADAVAAVAAVAAEGGMGLEVELIGDESSLFNATVAEDEGEDEGALAAELAAEVGADSWDNLGTSSGGGGAHRRHSGAMVAIVAVTTLVALALMITLYYYKRHLTRSFERNWMDWTAKDASKDASKDAQKSHAEPTAPLPSTANSQVPPPRTMTRMQGQWAGQQYQQHQHQHQQQQQQQQAGGSLGYMVSTIDEVPPRSSFNFEAPPPVRTTNVLHQQFEASREDVGGGTGQFNQGAFNALTQPEAIQML